MSNPQEFSDIEERHIGESSPKTDTKQKGNKPPRRYDGYNSYAERLTERCSANERSLANMKKHICILCFLCVIAIGQGAYVLNFTRMGDKILSLDSRLNNVENQLRLTQEHIKNIWTENASEDGLHRIRKLNEAREQLELAMHSTERILSDTTGTLDRTNEMQRFIHEYIFHKGAVTTVIIIVTIAVAALGLYVCVYRPWQPRYFSQAYESGAQQALDAVPICPLLDSTICIISFKSNRSAVYQALVRSALGTNGCADTMHEITKHTDIPRLPHCKIYIMCVEFCERRVIIEEPGQGLGDMKMTTYKAVNKLGGLLVIVYVNDPGSSRIQDLYSTEIHCVNWQPELQTLVTRNRFISTYDQLNDRQKNVLKQAVREALGRISENEAQKALEAVLLCPVLDSTVCIISFNSNRSADYQALVRSALGSSGCADTMHQITKHTDIPRLPHCKMYIMCVEFCERHVIIEEPGLAMGDIKRTTYEAVEKLGGVIVIVYVNHRGSSNIQDLYSTEIYCVSRQPQLKALEKRNRFISTYDQLNDRQRNALTQVVREALS